MVEPGKATQVTLYGRNLPGGKLDPAAVIDGRVLEKLTVTVTAPGDPRPLAAPQLSAGTSRRHRRGAGRLRVSPHEARRRVEPGPAVLRPGPGRARERRQRHAGEGPGGAACRARSPAASRRRRDRDWYTFNAKKGDVLMIEVHEPPPRRRRPTCTSASATRPTAKQDRDHAAGRQPRDAEPNQFLHRSTATRRRIALSCPRTASIS